MTEKKGFPWRETPITHWRTDSQRIFSPSLSLAVSHWPHSIFLWPFSNLLWHFIPPPLSPPHTAPVSLSHSLSDVSLRLCLTLTLQSHVISFPTLFSRSVLHRTPPYLTLATSPPLTWLVAWQNVCFSLWDIELSQPTEPTTQSRSMFVKPICFIAYLLPPSVSPTLLWVNVWVLSCSNKK